MRIVRIIALAAFVAWRAQPAPAQEPPVVVELFTSQGCSSCPPADAFLNDLARRPGILALGFHVDYWNYIGWTDPFAAAFATQRQRQYKASLHLRYIYTPQVVVNGAAEGIGAERDTIEHLIKAAAAKRAPHPDVTLTQDATGALLIHVGPAPPTPAPAWAVLWLVGFERPRQTRIMAGENEGRLETDVQAVHSFRRLPDWRGVPMDFTVPPAEVAKMSDGGAAVLLQEGGAGAILSAASVRFGQDKTYDTRLAPQ